MPSIHTIAPCEKYFDALISITLSSICCRFFVVVFFLQREGQTRGERVRVTERKKEKTKKEREREREKERYSYIDT